MLPPVLHFAPEYGHDTLSLVLAKAPHGLGAVRLMRKVELPRHLRESPVIRRMPVF
jgi:hypothetical protein